jgi:hypothetical protein
MQSWCFLVVSLASGEGLKRVNDLRQLPEKRMACVLQVAKQINYSPKQPLWPAPPALYKEGAAPNVALNPCFTTGSPTPLFNKRIYAKLKSRLFWHKRDLHSAALVF